MILLDENPIFYLGDIEMRHIKMVSHELPGRAAGPASILIKGSWGYGPVDSEVNEDLDDDVGIGKSGTFGVNDLGGWVGRILGVIGLPV